MASDNPWQAQAAQQALNQIAGGLQQAPRISFPTRRFRVTLASGDAVQHEAKAIGFEGGGLQLTEHPIEGGKLLIAFAPGAWVTVKEE